MKDNNISQAGVPGIRNIRLGIAPARRKSREIFLKSRVILSPPV
jgi:hypothetical protein